MDSSTSVSRKQIYLKQKLVENKEAAEFEKKNGPTTIEEHLEIVKNAVEFLKGCTDFKTKECYEHLKAIRLSSKSSMLNNEIDRDAMEDLVIKAKFAKLFPVMWQDFHSVDLSQGHDENDTKDRKVSIPHQAMSNLKCFKAVWWKFTDLSAKLVDELANTDALKLLVSDLEDPDLTLEKMQDSDSRQHLVEGTLGTIHNMVRQSDKQRKEIRLIENSADLLRNYASSEILIVQVNCVLILSYILYEDEYNKLKTNDSTVGLLVETLRESVDHTDHRCTLQKSVFSSAELMQGLNQIAVYDNNKVKIMDNGAIPPMVKMLGDTFSVQEKTLAAEGLWKLAFVDKHKERMKENAELLKGLMHLKNSEDAKLKDQCRGALWEIMDEEINFHKRLQTPVQESHVMISYQWDVQQRILYLRDMLKVKGYNIWIDDENMGDGILESMADAVEHAAVVLVCFSEKYKESQNCRTEAEYAFKLKKRIIPLKVEEGYKPDGWLGALIGVRKYFRFYNDDVASAEIEKIIKALGPQGKPGSWASSDVKKWLEENGLQELSPELKDLDGELLFQMYKRFHIAPEFFHNSMSKEFGLDYFEMLKFTRALEKVV